MSTQSAFVHNSETYKGLGSPWPAIANLVATVGPALFGGGKPNAKRRDAKRDALSQLGFNWIPTSGVPAGQEWNIDNWPDISLDKIADAFNRHGEIVAELHNQKKFNPGNTQSLSQIEQVIRQNGGSLNTGAFNFGTQGSVTQGGISNTGFNFNPWVTAIGVVVLAGVAASVLRDQPGSKRK